MAKGIPPGSILDAFEPLGYVDGDRRWRNTASGLIYTWDGRHGEVEVFDKRGRHVGALDPMTGKRIKNAVRGRRISV